MQEQMRQAMHSPETQALLTGVAFAAFVFICVVAIWWTKAKWNLLARPYRTEVKLRRDEKHRPQWLRIDGTNFKNLLSFATSDGLYLAHWGLLPQLMMPARLLIPWSACGDVYVKERLVWGFAVREHFIDVRTPARTVTVQLSGIWSEIVEKGFLRLSPQTRPA